MHQHPDSARAEQSKSHQFHLNPGEAERIQFESALSRAIVAHADDAIIAKRLDGTVITWNAGAERIFGYTAGEMIGQPITKLFPSDRLHEEHELIVRLRSGKTVSHFITRRVRKDGATVDISATLSPVRDASGKIVAVSKIARDITESNQRQAAAALAAVIVEQSNDAIISEALDGTVMTWNWGAEATFGYTAAEMIGRPITQLFPLDRLREETDLVALLHLGKTISHFETRRIRKDGVSIEVSVSLSPVRDQSGTIIAMSKIARDVTDRNKQQLSREARELRTKNILLERSNRDLEEFAYIASHDLKSPLTGISSVASWLEEDLQDSLSPESKKLLELMRSRLHRMGMLLDDLLTYSRVGRTDAGVSETKLADIFAGIIEMLNPPSHISVRVEGELPVIVTASAQLEQVLRNLIHNAIKHHDKACGEVVLSAKRTGDFVKFVVRDDGPGILPQYHAKIFQLFQTLKRRDEVESTGMGLAIVKRLVERHNCRITVQSEGNGTGTEFHFQWPASPLATGPEEPVDACT